MTEPPMPPPLPSPQEPLLHPTVYYKPVIDTREGRCLETERVQMRSPEDKVLSALCLSDFNNCLMQGACYVQEESGVLHLFNYYARGADGLPRFKPVDLNKCPYGYGMRNVCLDPYFTVAADLTVYKLGDVIFVPRLVGELMPDGEVHDGFLVIRDAGAAIQGYDRFDFYTGLTPPFSSKNPFFRLGFSNKKNSFEFRLASPEETARVQERTRYPGTRRVVLIPPKGDSNQSKNPVNFSRSTGL